MATNWTRTSIIYELRKRGLTAARLADEAGMSRSSFYSAMQRPYPRVQRMIALALGLSVHEIWPQFYGPDGRRLGLIASRRAA